MKFELIFLSGLRTNVGIHRNSILVVKLNLIKSSIPVLTRTVSGLTSDWESISENRIFRTVRFKERVQKEIIYVITYSVLKASQ